LLHQLFNYFEVFITTVMLAHIPVVMQDETKFVLYFELYTGIVFTCRIVIFNVNVSTLTDKSILN